MEILNKYQTNNLTQEDKRLILWLAVDTLAFVIVLSIIGKLILLKLNIWLAWLIGLIVMVPLAKILTIIKFKIIP